MNCEEERLLWISITTALVLVIAVLWTNVGG